ncbi:MAG TPA: bifunctional helix-turn-helix domain-containing protein/methylated-DNA--[protein]-cysteine S-methyltransferase [Rhizomicrobium sp.]|jgi:AraC family transcriptional regulator of adaptative response/methylated-DNA-[protein]-cysteine methyltransferase|nr:bifunctional helix-turn-helix domain-containing protein/methylated-DNA--[protein]-cysteine S-methyltransferase [Rhizomicrobium sp.]
MSNVLSFDENDANWRRMGRAIRYLSAHYLDQPSLEDAAAAVNLSPFHFQRLFTRYVGVSPKNFVGHLTLDHAKSDLAQGKNLLETSLDAGLSGPSRLHDLCLKIEAMTPGDYAKGGAGVEILYGFHPSPFGIALILATAKGVCGLAFGDEGEEKRIFADMRSRWPKANYREAHALTAKIAAQIFAKSAGDLSVHLMGTPWQVKVWQALLAIPPGRFSTYGVVAERIGSESAARAVGTAVGRNPISWLIPCHRVLASDGSLNGYHWGLERKRAMLALEAASQSERPRTSAMA